MNEIQKIYKIISFFLLTLLGVSLVSLCDERLETKMEKVWGQVLDDML